MQSYKDKGVLEEIPGRFMSFLGNKGCVPCDLLSDTAEAMVDITKY